MIVAPRQFVHLRLQLEVGRWPRRRGADSRRIFRGCARGSPPALAVLDSLRSKALQLLRRQLDRSRIILAPIRAEKHLPDGPTPARRHFSVDTSEHPPPLEVSTPNCRRLARAEQYLPATTSAAQSRAGLAEYGSVKIYTLAVLDQSAIGEVWPPPTKSAC
jgi:hypothetical protein